MGLGPFVGRTGLDQSARLVIHIGMALGRPVDAISPIKPGVEPLRGIGGAHLRGQHVAHFIEVGLGVLFGIEIAAFPAPIGPGPGQPVEQLPGVGFTGKALFLRQFGQPVLVGNAAPQPTGNVVLLEFPEFPGNAGLAEIFLRQHVAGHLGPPRGDAESVQVKYHRTVRVFDLAGSLAEFYGCVWRFVWFCKLPRDSHFSPIIRSRVVDAFGPSGPPVATLPTASFPSLPSLPVVPDIVSAQVQRHKM